MSRHLHFLMMPNLWLLSKKNTRIKTSESNVWRMYWLIKVYADCCFYFTQVQVKTSNWYHGSCNLLHVISGYVDEQFTVLIFFPGQESLMVPIFFFRNEHVWFFTTWLDRGKGPQAGKDKRLHLIFSQLYHSPTLFIPSFASAIVHPSHLSL